MAERSVEVGPERIFVINAKWLGVDVRGCELMDRDMLRIRTWRPKRGGDYLSLPPRDFVEDKSLHFPHCPERLSYHPESVLSSSNDLDMVCFVVDVHDIGQNRNLDRVQFLLIPCSALEAARIPGFEGGCIP